MAELAFSESDTEPGVFIDQHGMFRIEPSDGAFELNMACMFPDGGIDLLDGCEFPTSEAARDAAQWIVDTIVEDHS